MTKEDVRAMIESLPLYAVVSDTMPAGDARPPVAERNTRELGQRPYLVDAVLLDDLWLAWEKLPDDGGTP